MLFEREGFELVPKYTSYPVAPDEEFQLKVTEVVDDGYEYPLDGDERVKLPGFEHPHVTVNDRLPVLFVSFVSETALNASACPMMYHVPEEVVAGIVLVTLPDTPPFAVMVPIDTEGERYTSLESSVEFVDR